METIVIDGYNLIPALPTLGRFARRDLKKSRDSLVGLLRDYRNRQLPHAFILVVFDGKAERESKRESPAPGVEIQFSKGETADDLILKVLRKERTGATLVTSDRALIEAASGFANKVIRSGQFAKILLETINPSP
jgi:predicted RNA-binding protein with PIN domain